MTGGAPLIYLVATEESGDRLGGALMQACRERSRGVVRFAGVGGQTMARAGITSLFPIEEMSTMGFASVVLRLPHILRRIRQTADAVIAAKPDALVIIDSPDFTHRVARRVRRMVPSLPIIDYVSPSVWAWRPGRARSMRRYIDRVLALLPFEPDAHKRLGGPPCDYVGHPISEEAALLRPNQDEARRRDALPPVLLLLPGSRRGEVQRLLPIFRDTVEQVVRGFGKVDVVVPTIPTLEALVRTILDGAAIAPRIVSDPQEKRAAFRSARAALAASGTVSLELAVAGVPTVVAYKIPWIEELALRPLIRVPSIVLANLVLGENLIPEFIQRDVTATKLAAALEPLLAPSPERARQVEAFARLDKIMDIGGPAPSARAAEIVMRMMSATSAAK